tara:strand:- start:1363 stop:1593 length:231 start_codon:yes stop_codon:yes gene_type:complete
MSKTKRWIEKQIEDGNYTFNIPNFGDYIHEDEYQKELEAYQEYSECPIQKAYDEYEANKLNKYNSDAWMQAQRDVV